MLFWTGLKSEQTGGEHLLALPVFPEPAAVIAVNRQVNDEQAGNLGFSNPTLGHYSASLLRTF